MQSHSRLDPVNLEQIQDICISGYSPSVFYPKKPWIYPPPADARSWGKLRCKIPQALMAAVRQDTLDNFIPNFPYSWHWKYSEINFLFIEEGGGAISLTSFFIPFAPGSSWYFMQKSPLTQLFGGHEKSGKDLSPRAPSTNHLSDPVHCSELACSINNYNSFIPPPFK